MLTIMLYIVVIIFFTDYLRIKRRYRMIIEFMLREQREIRNRIFDHEDLCHKGDGK